MKRWPAYDRFTKSIKWPIRADGFWFLKKSQLRDAPEARSSSLSAHGVYCRPLRGKSIDAGRFLRGQHGTRHSGSAASSIEIELKRVTENLIVLNRICQSEGEGRAIKSWLHALEPCWAPAIPWRVGLHQIPSVIEATPTGVKMM
jgi:hypothetical protein